MTSPSSASNGETVHHPALGYTNGAYSEGFVDGRASMAETVAKQLLNQMSHAEISKLTGLTTDAIETLHHPDGSSASNPETDPGKISPTEDSRFKLIRETPTPDTAFVEPNFVRLIREVNQLTQAELAQRLNVHDRTVSTWETSEAPIRLRTATYDKLIQLSKTQIDKVDSV